MTPPPPRFFHKLTMVNSSQMTLNGKIATQIQFRNNLQRRQIKI